MKYIYLSLVLLLFQSCNKEVKYVKNIVVTDSIKILLREDIINPNSNIQPYWNYNEDLLSFLSNTVNDTIFISTYNLKTRLWKKKPLSIKGKNQVYSEGAFSHLSNSKIIYFPNIIPRALIINENGEVVNSYNYSDGYHLNYFSQNRSPNIYSNDSSFIFDLIEYNSLSNKNTYKNTDLLGIYDYKKQKLNKIIKYPDEFQNKVWSANDIERNSIVLNNKVYLNFTKSSKIYIYDLKGNLLKNSKVNFDKIKEAKERVKNITRNLLNKENNGFYFKIIYDKWRDIFYRIAVYYDTNKEIKTMQDLMSVIKKRTIGIIAFDKELKIIAKNKFSTNETKISENFYFVNEKGLNLMSYNDIESEELKFITLTVK